MALLSSFLTNWRFSYLERYISGNVLDVGCGIGLVYSRYHSRIKNYCGVDSNSNLVEKLSVQFSEAIFLQHDLDKTPLKLNLTFDTIILLAVIEHVWNQKLLFEGILQHLNPDGRILITTPTPFGNDLVHSAGARLGLFAKSAADDHIVIYNKKRFRILEEEFNLRIHVYKRFQFFSNQFVVLGKQSVT